MRIHTEIDTNHLELIKIFLDANELVGVVVTEQNLEIGNQFHKTLCLESTVEDSSVLLTFMGVRHAGILNMFDDYLMKCGVSWDAIKPATIHRQIQSQREDQENQDFMKYLLAHKDKNEHSKI